ncbi:hypothetical protein Q9R32_17625, partial [Actinotalea sp. AC32]|nr:hypothetical protein [Actinotalea sp. AC32]
VDEATARAWPDALAAVGVRTGLPVTPVPAEAYDADEPDADDVPGAGPDGPDDVALLVDRLDGWHEYVRATGLTGRSAPQDVVEDLDAVRDGAWPEVLSALAVEHPRTLGPVAPEGAPSWTAWTLRRLVPGLGRPFALAPGSGRADDAAPVGASTAAVLLPAAPDVVAGLPEQVRRALGGVAGLGELDAAGWTAVLGALDHGAAVPPAEAVAAWAALARLAVVDPEAAVDGPSVPALDADGATLAAALDDVVVCSPAWAQRTDLGPRVVVPAEAVDAVASMLDADAAEDRAAGAVTSRGVRAGVPDAVRALLPDAPWTWVEHEDLRVDGRPVAWWVDDDGVVHASTTEGLACGVAAVVGWSRRHLVARLLTGGVDVDAERVALAGELDG